MISPHLADDADLFPEPHGVQLPDISTVHGDCARLGVVQTQQQPGDGGFTRAAGPHHRHHRAWPEGEGMNTEPKRRQWKCEELSKKCKRQCELVYAIFAMFRIRCTVTQLYGIDVCRYTVLITIIRY